MFAYKKGALNNQSLWCTNIIFLYADMAKGRETEIHKNSVCKYKILHFAKISNINTRKNSHLKVHGYIIINDLYLLIWMHK